MVGKTAPRGWSLHALYDGAVVIGFDQYGGATGIGHSYWLKTATGRELIPGVTGVSGLLTEAASGLSPWAAWCAVKYLKEECSIAITDEQQDSAIKAHEAKRDTAAVRGTDVHHALEAIVNGEKAAAKPSAAWKRAQQVKELLDKGGYTVISSERKVYSRAHNYVGTMDLHVKDKDGCDLILDLKTSKAFRLAHALQISAYAAAYAEEFPETHFADAGVIVAASAPKIKMLSAAMRMPGEQALAACHNAFLGLLAVRTSIPDIKNFGRE